MIKLSGLECNRQVSSRDRVIASVVLASAARLGRQGEVRR